MTTKKALVTGGSRGIGAAIKEILELQGVQVYAPSRTERDLMSKKSIQNYMDGLNQDMDILINNAGINELSSLEDITDENIERMLQVNLTAQIQLIRAVTPGMKKNKYGRIVNISSIWGIFSKEKRGLYTIAKAGVNGLTKAAAVELSAYNILTNAVAPGFINTEMTAKNNTPEQIKVIVENLPIKRMGDAKEIAEWVGFLASEKNSFMTGQILMIDGGFSCV